MKTIYSMASSDKVFALYEKRKGATVRAAKPSDTVVIKGGAGVANKLTKRAPNFVETKVTEEQMKVLEANPVFQRAVKTGYLTTTKPTAKKKDKGAQLTKAQLKEKAGRDVDITTNVEKPE